MAVGKRGRRKRSEFEYPWDPTHLGATTWRNPTTRSQNASETSRRSRKRKPSASARSRLPRQHPHRSSRSRLPANVPTPSHRCGARGRNVIGRRRSSDRRSADASLHSRSRSGTGMDRGRRQLDRDSRPQRGDTAGERAGRRHFLLAAQSFFALALQDLLTTTRLRPCDFAR
jgi:hypothetical protein